MEVEIMRNYPCIFLDSRAPSKKWQCIRHGSLEKKKVGTVVNGVVDPVARIHRRNMSRRVLLPHEYPKPCLLKPIYFGRSSSVFDKQAHF
mmetsp:Transcript_12274/g.30965  ORF Transcript_12274/g.30965 Transcript_12274/m.30965 type:complete len:90 (+) Transcript_12274:1224-1493(+)